MGFLLAIEGADGAGKGTATAAVVERLRARGISAASMSFPRYATTSAGWLLGEYLGGRLPRSVSPHAAATFYALDRLESRADLAEAIDKNQIVVLDRYIASNMVYQAAQLPADAAPSLIAWIVALETGQFALPAPDLSIYLDTPSDVARAHILLKQRRSYTDGPLDAYELDGALQERVRALYAALSATNLIGAWARVDTTDGSRVRDPADIAEQIVRLAIPQMEAVS